MTRFWRLAALLLILSPAAAQARSKGERLITPALLDFTVVHAETGPYKAVQLVIPEGQSLANWTRMVRTQRFARLARRTTPDAYAERMRTMLPDNCPDALVSPVESMRLAGHDAARFKVICNKPIAGVAESFVLQAIAGKRDMYVEQVAFRGKAGAEDFLWARKFLDGVFLCAPGSKSRLCQ